MIDLTKINTEKENPRTSNFSSMTTREAIQVMNEEDLNAVKCIGSQIDKLESLIELTGASLKKGGRIIYMGAGTSGRLGVLDAAECPPTFGVDPGMVVGLIAGGQEAFINAVEGAEDSREMAVNDLKGIDLNEKDIVIGIAASGRTPYVLGGLEYAKSMGVRTGGVVCTFDSEIAKVADITIEAVPGPEVVTGSTRLKAGTATKLVLNMISTISMKSLGKIYKNYMVDLKLSNKKLNQRAINIVMAVTDVDETKAIEVLEEADGHVKLAITMILLSCDRQEASKLLEDAGGHIELLKK